MNARCNIHWDIIFSKVLDYCIKHILAELYKCWCVTGCHTGIDEDIASLLLHNGNFLVGVEQVISLPGSVTML